MNFPPSVAKFFWGDDLTQLSLEQHSKYITQTLLEKGDAPAIEWLFSHHTAQDIKALLPHLKLSRKSANFWRVYLT